MTKRVFRWPIDPYLCMAIGVACFFCLFQLDRTPPGLWYDEAHNGTNALHAGNTLKFRAFYRDNFGREGLLINIQALVLFFAPSTPTTLRTPTAVFGILTIAGFFLLSLELLRQFSRHPEQPDPAIRLACLLASILYATSFWHVVLSRMAVRAALVPCFLIWALFLYSRAQRATRRNAVILGALAGGIYGAGFYTYPNFRMTPLLLFVAFWLFRGHRHLRLASAVFLGAALLVVQPLAQYTWRYPNQVLSRFKVAAITSRESPLAAALDNLLETIRFFLVEGSTVPRHGFLGAPLLLPPVAVFCALGAAVLVLPPRGRLRFAAIPEEALARRGPVLCLLAAWLVVGLIPGILARPGTNRLNLCAAPLYLLAGLGLAQILVWARSISSSRVSWVVRLVPFIIVGVIGLREFRTYFVAWAQDSRTQKAFLAQVSSLDDYLDEHGTDQPVYLVRGRGAYYSIKPLEFLMGASNRREMEARDIFYINRDELETVPDEALVILVTKRQWKVLPPDRRHLRFRKRVTTAR